MKKVMLVEDEEFILQGIRYIIDWEEIAMEVSDNKVEMNQMLRGAYHGTIDRFNINY